MSPRGVVSRQASPVKVSILAPSRLHVPGGRPAFMQRWSRYSSLSQPCSTGTCGRNSPLRPINESISPSRPMTMLLRIPSGVSARIASGLLRTVTSTVTPPSSPRERRGNLGSLQADPAASTMALPRGITGIGMPMHPRSSPAGNVSRVTNAPAESEKALMSGIAGAGRPEASASTADLASLTASSPCSIIAHRHP